MNRYRLPIAGLLLLGLVILAIVHAVRRFQSITETTIDRSLADIRGQVARHAVRLEDDLALGKRHTRYLASHATIRELLEQPSAETFARACRDAAAVLYHFPSFGGIVVLDGDGTERLRIERMGGGVAIIPESLLRTRSDPERARAASTQSTGVVTISPLEFDSNRVDVSEENRVVLRYSAAIISKKPGALILSVYAAPLYATLRDLNPLPGAHLLLIDSEGFYLIGPELQPDASTSVLASRMPSETDTWSFAIDSPRAYEAIVKQKQADVYADGDYYVASESGPRPDGHSASWWLIAHVPTSTLLRDVSSFQSEAIGVGLVLIATLAAIAIVGFGLVRLDAERKRLAAERDSERKLLETERLAAIGRLTAGVAHEINNPLSGIRNYLALLDRENTDAERRREYISLIQHGLERIGAIVRDLLSFANPPKPTRASVDLAGVLERVVRIARHDVGFREINWTFAIDNHCPAVWADSFALEQVFLNFALNARDALARQSKDHTRRIHVAAKCDAKNQSLVEITFEDTGPGIAPDVLPHIFEPFFTTRSTGNGLGLSVSASIIRAHGGEIRASNQPGGGARFTILLPSASNTTLPTEPVRV